MPTMTTDAVAEFKATVMQAYADLIAETDRDPAIQFPARDLKDAIAIDPNDLNLKRIMGLPLSYVVERVAKAGEAEPCWGRCDGTGKLTFTTRHPDGTVQTEDRDCPDCRGTGNWTERPSSFGVALPAAGPPDGALRASIKTAEQWGRATAENRSPGHFQGPSVEQEIEERKAFERRAQERREKENGRA